jgi:hypothetical protein
MLKRIILLLLLVFVLVGCKKVEFVAYDKNSDVPDLGIVLDRPLKYEKERNTENGKINAYVYKNISMQEYSKYAKRLVELDYKQVTKNNDLTFLDRYFAFMLPSQDNLYITPETANYYENSKTLVTVINGVEYVQETKASETVTLVYVMPMKEFRRLQNEVKTE